MITVAVKNNERDFVMEISAGIAGDVLHALSSYRKKISKNTKGNCVVTISMDFIDKLNKELMPFKKELQFDKSFITWKTKHKTSIKSPLLIKCGPVFSRIYRSTDYDIPHTDIEDVCKYFFKPAVNQKSYKDKKWDGYIHLYKKNIRQFPAGLLNDVLEVLDKKEIPYKVEYLYDTSPPREFSWKAKDLFALSEDQVSAIAACIEAKRCVVKAATGFGKTSALARYLTAERAVPTLFIANKKVLLDDAAKDFEGGIDGIEKSEITQIKDGWFGSINLRKADNFTQEDIHRELDDKKIIVATIQSLSTRLEDARTGPALRKWLKEKCKFLMVDETQAVGTKQWDEVLEKIDAPYRVFLSATPKRLDGATLKIFAYSGPLIFDTTAKEQIEKGRLCDMRIEYYPFNHNLYNENDKDLDYNEIYTSSISENDERNREITRLLFEMLSEERQVLVLIQRIEHGHKLKEMFLEEGLDIEDVRFIWGDTLDKIRQQIITDFRENKFRVLIGSTVADAGLNIPSIGGVLLCGAGNSDITHIQRIGRGARTFDYQGVFGYVPRFVRDASGVKVTRVIDILDNNIAFFKRQAKNRYCNACDEFGAERVFIVGADKSIFRAIPKAPKQKVGTVEAKALHTEFFAAFTDIDRGELEKVIASNDSVVSDFLKDFKK